MYRTALVPLDGTKSDENILGHLQAMLDRQEIETVLLARALQSPPVAAVDYALDPAVVAGLEQDLRQSATSYLERIARRLDWRGAEHDVVVMVGEPADDLVSTVAKRGVDLILIASDRRRGAWSWLRTSLLDRLLGAVNVPITVLSAPETRGRRQLRVPHAA